MRVYLVGGAVRDSLLGRPSNDKDYVVVGATPDDMLSQGFKKVGADFPVFLHPSTGEEYALARTERKTGSGYNGFSVAFDTSVTLEDDLRRRDLTINAMARDLNTGELHDPFDGQKDLKAGILRHVSEAFAEDPVRVLRVARFAARYSFTVAPETLELMKKLVADGEMQTLTVERVWNEVEKALAEPYADQFFRTLQDCGAVLDLFPEVCGRSFKLNELRRAALRKALTPAQRLAVLLANMEDDKMQDMFARLKAPTEFSELTQATLVMNRKLPNGFCWREADGIFKDLETMNAWRKPELFHRVAESLMFCSERPQIEYVDALLASLDLTMKVQFQSLSTDQQKSLKGKDIGKAIADLRKQTLEQHYIEKVLC